MAMSKFSKSSAALPPFLRENLSTAIPLVSKMKKMDKVDGPDVDTFERINL
jgi:hypothetical protein